MATNQTLTTTSKKWYTSKTIWLNIIGLVIAAAGELSNAFPAGQVAKVMGFVLTIGNIILRLITTQPITGTVTPPSAG
jgi:hypothetical protein